MELIPTENGADSTYDVLIPGDYFCDVIFTGLTEFPALNTEIYSTHLNVVPGGGALNTTIGLRRLGMNVGWVGRLGNDFFSAFIDQVLQREGISTAFIERLDQPLRRVTVALSYPEDRAFVSYVDDIPDWMDHALALLEHIHVRHIHFPGLVIDSRLPSMLDRCHQLRMSLSMDCQYRGETLSDPLVSEILARLDIFMPNAREAMRLAQTDQIEEAVSALAGLVPYVVIKEGEAGSRAKYQEQHYHSPVVPAEVVDTTGAGDAFNAGFLAAYLQGREPVECLTWGNFCGSRCVRGIGGTSTLPTIEELQQWLRQP
ncbi:MAG TPA: carbohydrate kinase family protein [Aggregatilineales bacterium]|nr:carbohydrate kinase family protein [Aggregatilineales bacterium]